MPENMPDRIKYPLEFKQCPHCGGKDFIFKLEAAELKRQNAIGLDCPLGLMFNTQLRDARLPTPPLFPVITTTFDICVNPECGALVAVRVERRMAAKPPNSRVS